MSVRAVVTAAARLLLTFYCKQSQLSFGNRQDKIVSESSFRCTPVSLTLSLSLSLSLSHTHTLSFQHTPAHLLCFIVQLPLPSHKLSHSLNDCALSSLSLPLVFIGVYAYQQSIVPTPQLSDEFFFLFSPWLDLLRMCL